MSPLARTITHPMTAAEIDMADPNQADKRPVSVSFIVPALNEQDVIASVTYEIWTIVDAKLSNFEIILIDDGSTDDTGRIMDQLAIDLPYVRALHNKPNIGLGASYALGVKHARLDYVMMLCGDGGLPATSLPAIIDKVGEADIVVPYMTNLKRIKTPARFLLSRTYTTLLNTVFGFRLNYYNGLPVHRRALLQKIRIQSSGFGFQGEILIKLLKSGATFEQVGVLGAENTARSSALKPRNLISVAATFARLLKTLTTYKAER